MRQVDQDILKTYLRYLKLRDVKIPKNLKDSHRLFDLHIKGKEKDNNFFGTFSVVLVEIAEFATNINKTDRCIEFRLRENDLERIEKIQKNVEIYGFKPDRTYSPSYPFDMNRLNLLESAKCKTWWITYA